jgi:hypothetical protein
MLFGLFFVLIVTKEMWNKLQRYKPDAAQEDYTDPDTGGLDGLRIQKELFERLHGGVGGDDAADCCVFFLLFFFFEFVGGK